jgi:hypothetical protein
MLQGSPDIPTAFNLLPIATCGQRRQANCTQSAFQRSLGLVVLKNNAGRTLAVYDLRCDAWRWHRIGLWGLLFTTCSRRVTAGSTKLRRIDSGAPFCRGRDVHTIWLETLLLYCILYCTFQCKNDRCVFRHLALNVVVTTDTPSAEHTSMLSYTRPSCWFFLFCSKARPAHLITRAVYCNLQVQVASGLWAQARATNAGCIASDSYQGARPTQWHKRRV